MSGTVARKWAKGTGGPAGDEHYNLVPDVYRKAQKAHHGEDGERWEADDRSATLDAAGHAARTAHVAFYSTGGRDAITDEDRSSPIKVGSGLGIPSPPAVAFQASDYAKGEYEDADRARPVTTSNDRSRAAPVAIQQARATNGRQGGAGVRRPGDPAYTLQGRDDPGVATPVPRRLTPRECERLQGFPDDWTATGTDEDGEEVEISDTQRYKQMGNAVSVPVAAWIGARIAAVDSGAPPPQT